MPLISQHFIPIPSMLTCDIPGMPPGSAPCNCIQCQWQLQLGCFSWVKI